MLKVTIELTGDTWNDIRQAAEEVTRQLEDEYRSGGEQNDTGGYTFDVSGEEKRHQYRATKRVSVTKVMTVSFEHEDADDEELREAAAQAWPYYGTSDYEYGEDFCEPEAEGWEVEEVQDAPETKE